MAGPTDTATLEPIPVPEPDEPEHKPSSPASWARENLFSGPRDAVLTIVFGVLLVVVIVQALRFVFVTGRWEIVQVNLLNYMLGSFPRDALWRPWAAVLVFAATIGLCWGLSGRGRTFDWRSTLRKVGPPLVLLAVLLSFTRTVVPAALTVAAVALAVSFRFLGTRLPERATRYVGVIAATGVVLAYAAFTAFDGVAYAVWGGLLLTLFLAVGGITLSFPLGVLLALGRRSSLPVVRVVCVCYIELIRGVPLITVLLMGQFMLGFLFPPGATPPEDVTRALVALTLFTAAYVAEIVRGGLQGVPGGQVEAAKSIGLSPLKTTRMIVLPQALRNVIPAIVGQFISLFKDTSLVAILGLVELLRVSELIVLQPQFQGQGLTAEVLLFASFVYWVFCYSMSRASQRLETRLGVGVR